MNEEEIKVGEILLSKEDLQKTLKTKRGNFVVKIANPLDKKLIIRNTAASIGQANVQSVTAADYYFITAMETMRIVIIESPDWFESVDTCMDDELILDLYGQYIEFEKRFRRLLRQNKFGRDSKGD